MIEQAVKAAPMTLAQKIIAHACGQEHVVPGQIVTARVDLAMSHDSSGPRRVGPMLEQLGAKVWDASKYVIITDHYTPAYDAESRQIVQFARDWARQAGIQNFHDEEGICHVVLPENGHLKPGMFVVGGDSHSTTGGAFGAYMFGIGATEMLGVLVTGGIWVRVPETIIIEWRNRLPAGVAAKDMMLHACAALGMDGGQYQAVEYTGEAVRALPMQERMTLSNMAAELGAQAGLVAPDEVTRAYLASVGVKELPCGLGDAYWQTDCEAPVLARHVFDAATLAPQVAAPHSPANSADVEHYKGQAIDTCYIGACTGAKLEDLCMAARVLRGRRIASGVRLLVAPASIRDQSVAQSEGVMQILAEAGATVLSTGCGACAGYGASRFAENERVISSSARNFKGRMGADSSLVWLASPYTVAASAVAGQIAEPRNFLE